MYMSVDSITILIGIASVLLAIAGGFGWMIHRMDGIARDLDARMDRMSAGLDARVERMSDELGARMDRMSDELVEVKIAIARVEGPPRHLLTGR
ncbi:response regulator [Microbacterium esteraromaticum]